MLLFIVGLIILASLLLMSIYQAIKFNLSYQQSELKNNLKVIIKLAVFRSLPAASACLFFLKIIQQPIGYKLFFGIFVCLFSIQLITLYMESES